MKILHAALRHTEAHICFLLLMLAICIPVTQAAPPAAPYKILMVLWRGETAKEVTFKKHLERLQIPVSFTTINGNMNRTYLGTLLRQLRPAINKKEFDIIYTYGTTATTMVSLIAHENVPIVFSTVFDPVGAHLVESLDRPEHNITGVTNGVPIDAQLDVLHDILPFKNMVLLFTGPEKNASLLARSVGQWESKNHIHLTTFRVAPQTTKLDEALNKIASGDVPCDVIYAGADTYLASQAEYIHSKLGNRFPLLGGAQAYVKKGWLASYSVPHEEMGRSAARKVQAILQGKNAGTIPVTLPRPVVNISRNAAKRFNISLPEGATIWP